MVKYARAIQAADYDYELLEANSNAFIGAMIAAAGGEPLAMLPEGIGRREAVGYSSFDEILDDIEPPANGTVVGTETAERIAGIQVGEVIRALGGADVVRAGRGNDRVVGGDGADRLLGQDGADHLRGDRGRDTLVGGIGADLLMGGLGRNRLSGGPGADVFRFREPARDRIEDFEDGIDLIRIDAGAASFADIVVSRFGGAGQHTRITFDATVIELRGFDRDLLDAGDFVFPLA